MLSSVSLAPEIRVQLEAARRILGLSQADLSTMAGLSQGNVSNCLQGKVVRIESLHRLLSAFAAAVASATERGVGPEHAAELQKVIEAARKSVDVSSEEAVYLARPGGPMPENATNRIRRQEDDLLLAALDDAPFTAAVTGPPECGKSTLLGLLAAEARRGGFAVVEFDTMMILPPGKEGAKDEDGDLNDVFFRELAEEVGRTLGERPEERQRWTRFDLLRFLKDTRLRRPAPPLLIVVDHASWIELALEELIQVCRTLDAHRGRTQMSWAFAVEASKEPVDPALGVLSRLAPSPLVELGWLTREELGRMAKFYGIEDGSRLDELWDWSLGQPFLTHAVLTRFRDMSSVMDDEARWQRMWEEIEGGGDAELNGHLSRTGSRIRANENFREKYPRVANDWNSRLADAAFLDKARQFGLVAATKTASSEDQCAVVKFYRDHLRI